MFRSMENSYRFAHGSRQISHVSGDGDLYPRFSQGRRGYQIGEEGTFFTLRVRYPAEATCFARLHARRAASQHALYEMALS